MPKLIEDSLELVLVKYNASLPVELQSFEWSQLVSQGRISPLKSVLNVQDAPVQMAQENHFRDVMEDFSRSDTAVYLCIKDAAEPKPLKMKFYNQKALNGLETFHLYPSHPLRALVVESAYLPKPEEFSVSFEYPSYVIRISNKGRAPGTRDIPNRPFFPPQESGWPDTAWKAEYTQVAIYRRSPLAFTPGEFAHWQRDCAEL